MRPLQHTQRRIRTSYSNRGNFFRSNKWQVILQGQHVSLLGCHRVLCGTELKSADAVHLNIYFKENVLYLKKWCPGTAGITFVRHCTCTADGQNVFPSFHAKQLTLLVKSQKGQCSCIPAAGPCTVVIPAWRRASANSKFHHRKDSTQFLSLLFCHAAGIGLSNGRDSWVTGTITGIYTRRKKNLISISAILYENECKAKSENTFLRCLADLIGRTEIELCKTSITNIKDPF